MKKNLIYRSLFAFLILAFLTPAGQVFAGSFDSPNLSVISKILTAGRAIAAWPSGIPAGEKRPVLVFLPGWGGVGAVAAAITGENTNLVNEGYVTLAIGFDSSSTWNSDIEVKTRQGLDKLCVDPTIPANCSAIVLVGSSYGAAQNYWVIEYLRSNGYAGGAGSKGKMLGFLSEDAGYGAPGNMTDPNTGAYTRTGLANTASYSVAMIENLGDTTFPVDECTWGNCGARELSNAHLARGDSGVFSMCPPGGEHGTRGFANWNSWVVSTIKTMIHVTHATPTFTGYTNPTLSVANTCVDASNTTILPGLSVSGINIVANGQPVRLRGVNMGDPFWARNPDWYPNYSTADYNTLAQDWGANVVRISIFPTQWKHMDHATLLAGLSTEINAALNSGMYVIISYHVIGWPDGFYQSACCGNAADTYDSSMSVATSFWTQMAQTYGSDTRIIFDLWNEPAHPDDFTLYGSDPNPLWPILKGYYQSLIQTARTNGAQNIVLAAGNRWSSWLVGIKDNPLADSNVVYAYHKYSVEGLNTAAEWDRDTDGLIEVKPVLVSEWGYEDSDVTNPTWPGSQASYGDPFTQWMDDNHLSSLAWMYHHDWTPALLTEDGGLTNYGVFVKSYISENTHVSFSDVPTSYPYWQDIEILYANGLTAGCSVTPLNFCPDQIMDRAQSAVFNLRGNFGISYVPPVAPWNRFADDWSSGTWAEKWAEGMYNAGLTAGCATGPLRYCPWDPTPRVQAAVFGLRLKYGNSYAPPAATGTIFFDLTDPAYFGTKWAEKAYADGLLPNCGTDTGSGQPLFCPDDPLTRGLGAYMIVRARNLSMP
jgi:Cellulase (glycosyl hydrolase family 5)